MLAEAGVVAAAIRPRRSARGCSQRRGRCSSTFPLGRLVDACSTSWRIVLAPGDVIVDGGNSYWGDSIRRAERLAARGLELVDAGTTAASRARATARVSWSAAPRPVGRGRADAEQLAVPGGYVHAGPPGAGHFTKLVHNGIEFGMIQAIGEGVDLLERYPDRLDITAVLACWRNGSVIRSWLVDLMHQQYATAGGMDKIPAFVEDTGEVNWLVADALRMELPIPVIAQAVMQLFASRDDRQELGARDRDDAQRIRRPSVRRGRRHPAGAARGTSRSLEPWARTRRDWRCAMDHEVVVITGASAGVGRATAREFARHGAWVGLLARDQRGSKQRPPRWRRWEEEPSSASATSPITNKSPLPPSASSRRWDRSRCGSTTRWRRSSVRSASSGPKRSAV